MYVQDQDRGDRSATWCDSWQEVLIDNMHAVDVCLHRVYHGLTVAVNISVTEY